MFLKIFFATLISFFLFSGSTLAAENPYGFRPASATVHNYTVTDGTTSVLLRDFEDHLKPLREDFIVADLTHYEEEQLYQEALSTWQQSDGGKWANLWPYVPMFSREDVKGFVQAVDEPFQNTNPNPVEVAIPHLARTYEVASALSYILSPFNTDRSYSEPNLSSQWINPAPWENDKFWFDSDESQPGNWDGLGAVCDPQQLSISSSGDLAYDNQANTATFKELEIDNPFYNAEDPDACVKTITVVDPITHVVTTQIDDSDCFVDQAVRFSPTYLKTYTPFLHAIVDRLLTGPNAVFNIFKPYAEIANEEIENWPGVGNSDEESLSYSFSGGQAEAGLKQNPEEAKYYFKYLGTLHCQKEKLMVTFLPFLGGSLGGSDYEIDPQCAGGGQTTTDDGPIPPTPGGAKWMQWPCTGGYIQQSETLALCYEDPDRPFHKGLDLQCPDSQVRPSAPGKVVAVNNNPGAHGFGRYVIIEHSNGWFTLYAHLLVATARVGQNVDTNNVIGTQDNSGSWSRGSHVHLGLSQGGNPNSFINPGPTADPCAAIDGCSCQ